MRARVLVCPLVSALLATPLPRFARVPALRVPVVALSIPSNSDGHGRRAARRQRRRAGSGEERSLPSGVAVAAAAAAAADDDGVGKYATLARESIKQGKPEMALELYDSSLVVPTHYVLFTLSSIVAPSILYQELTLSQVPD